MAESSRLSCRRYKWLSRKSWIIEGVGYWEEMKERISKSDIVMFLDVPVVLCMKRAEARITEERSVPNPDKIEGCAYGEVKERQIETIEYFQNSLRPKLVKLLSELNPDNVRIISAYSELDIETETYSGRRRTRYFPARHVCGLFVQVFIFGPR
ncbi:MAG: hypothetical protein AB2806_12535 [Candidatus Thiodiazotropha sp.]